jgi:hypothetical protein
MQEFGSADGGYRALRDAAQGVAFSLSRLRLST